MSLLDQERVEAPPVWTSSGVAFRGPSLAATRLITISSLLDVTHEDDVWVVREVETGIFGSGEDEPAAFRDLVAALTEHRDVLERQEALSPDLESQLAYLQRLLG